MNALRLFSPMKSTILIIIALFVSFSMRIQYLTNGIVIGRTLKFCLLLLFLMFVLKHLIVDKLKFETDEWLVVIFTALAYFSGLGVNSDLCIRNIGIPSEFLLAYLGFSVYLKTTNLKLKNVHMVLFAFFVLYFIHVIIAVITAPSLSFNPSMSLYQYVINSWQILPYARGDMGLYCMSGGIIMTSFSLYYFEKKRKC